MNQILYGVGKAVVKDYVDKKKVIALAKLKDLNINFSGNEEAVSGGDSPYPITYFPKDKAISVTATNALFDIKLMGVTQGTSVTKGAVEFTEFIEADIPADGVVKLDFSPKAGSVLITDYTEVDTEASVATGKFYVDVTNKEVVFAVADAGKSVDGIYTRTSSANAETISGTKDTFAKPFEFTHRIPVYNDNNTIVGQGQLVIYKAKATNSFDMGLQPQQAFAPKLELKALDPKRPDGKLWDFTIEPVA